jgi:predicted DNA binding CopG/RHH family protein
MNAAEPTQDVSSPTRTKESFKQIDASEVIEEGDENEDIFAGEYEEYVEPVYFAHPEANDPVPPVEDFSSLVKPKRNQLFKIIITRPKREFESPYTFNDKGPGEEGTVATFEIKSRPNNEYQTLERVYIELGLQTANDSIEKSYQVPKMRTKNSFSQVEVGLSDIKEKFESAANSYLTNSINLVNIENFLNKVRSLMEQALQSNETIDIFQNDFDLDQNTMVKTDEEKKDKKVEMRTFRANISGQKGKGAKKNVNYIRFVRPDEIYLAHTLIRNLTFEERTKVVGIPYTAQIYFWNFNNREINSPVFVLDVPMEITVFEFCPTNIDKLACGLYSGQIIFFDFKDLLGILNRASDSELLSNNKKGKFIINLI